MYIEMDEHLGFKLVQTIRASNPAGMKRIIWMKASSASIQKRDAIRRAYEQAENSVIQLICLSRLEVLSPSDLRDGR